MRLREKSESSRSDGRIASLSIKCYPPVGLLQPVFETSILNRIPRGQQQRTGIEIVIGETSDVSEWIDFEFYD
jgi:hypothetical protein